MKDARLTFLSEPVTFATNIDRRRAGLPALGTYVADKGFAGERPRRQWAALYQVDLLTPPHQTSKRLRWPKTLRRWLASLWQIIETVNDKLLNTFRLARERPHDLTGFQARLAAKAEPQARLSLRQKVLREAQKGSRT